MIKNSIILLITSSLFVSSCANKITQPTEFQSTTHAIRTIPLPKLIYDDIILFNWWRCDASPHGGSCSGEKLLEAPLGSQVCKFLYQEFSKSGSASHHEFQELFYINDPENPDRYRGIKAKIHAETGLFDDSSAWIELRNVGIRVIPANATNNDRYTMGCWM